MTGILERLSLNQRTTQRWSVAEAVAGCVRGGLPSIGLWREPVADVGVEQARKLVADAGLRVSSLCRGGFLTAIDATDRAAALADNRRAIDEAATLEAACLVMVVGGLPAGSKDVAGARARVADAVTELAPYAADRGVHLGLEPLHPIFAADRSVLSTLGQALDIAERFPVGQLGVVVDSFNVWWDPEVLPQIARAADRIASYQISDWVLPIPEDNLLCRGMVGDGYIDFDSLQAAVDAAGYTGDIEVEIFNADVWAADPDEVVATIRDRAGRIRSS